TLFVMPWYTSALFIGKLLLILSLASCQGKTDITNFNEDQWKQDAYACKEQRANMEKDLLGARKELLGLTQQEIRKLLGKPERQELYTRGQKFFMYYLSPAVRCKEAGEITNARMVFFRFSALNEVNEIFVEEVPLSE